MAKKAERKRKKAKSPIRRRIRLIVLAAVLVLLVLFLSLFQITNVIVTGNDRYTDEQIKGYCIDDSTFNNTVIYSLMHQRVEPEAVPLLEYIEVIYVDRNTIQLKVHEKQTIGMFRVGEKVCCIDQDGRVIEILDYAESGDLNLPLINGLGSRGTVGEVIELEDDSVLNVLQALKSAFDKYELMPESIDVEKNEKEVYIYTLHYGNVTVQLGADELLEEKMRRVSAIVPQISEMSGTLHLENYEEDTENIVFDTNTAGTE